MSMRNTSVTADVLVDADNVAHRRGAVVESVARDASERELALRYVHVVGRNLVVLGDYAQAFRASVPGTSVSTARASRLRNSADVLAGIWLGRISHDMAPHEGSHQVYILTRDKLVLAAARAALGVGVTLVVPHDAPTAALSKDDGPFRLISLPGPDRPHLGDLPTNATTSVWATNPVDPATSAGLRWVCTAVSTPQPPPSFVPFPTRLSVVRLGGGGGAVDLDLSPWDGPGRRRSLYSPHVEFRYFSAPDSCWTIRSMHGHRTGKRKVALDGKLISASTGPKTIHTGTVLDIGIFTFTFQDNRILNHASFEDPKGMVERLERGFRSLVETLSHEAIPARVRSELSEGAEFSWERAYLVDYQRVFESAWGRSLIEWLDRTFHSRTEIQRDLGSLNRIRNVVFHPSRPPLSDRDREKLANLYCRYADETVGWHT